MIDGSHDFMSRGEKDGWDDHRVDEHLARPSLIDERSMFSSCLP